MARGVEAAVGGRQRWRHGEHQNSRFGCKMTKANSISVSLSEGEEFQIYRDVAAILFSPVEGGGVSSLIRSSC